ncbi:hypothetical protein PT2222_190104 [Paraburkholderia tropica]
MALLVTRTWPFTSSFSPPPVAVDAADAANAVRAGSAAAASAAVKAEASAPVKRRRAGLAGCAGCMNRVDGTACGVPWNSPCGASCAASCRTAGRSSGYCICSGPLAHRIVIWSCGALARAAGLHRPASIGIISSNIDPTIDGAFGRLARFCAYVRASFPATERYGPQQAAAVRNGLQRAVSPAASSAALPK